MRHLFTIMSILVGLILGTFSQAWSGTIEGQILRVVSGGKVVPVYDVPLIVYQDEPGLPECAATAETKIRYIASDRDGKFSFEDLEAGLYHVCGGYDYEVDDPDSNRKITVVLTKRVRVSPSGVVQVIFKK